MLPAFGDILFTCKAERFPINAGFVAVRDTLAARAFLTSWRDKSREICENKSARLEAVSRNGAADQEALWQMIGRPTGSLLGEWTATVAGAVKVDVVGVPCELFNETNSVPLSSAAAVLHYKGAWHNVLAKGQRFGRKRTRAASAEMYELWSSHLSREERAMGVRLRPAWVAWRIALRERGISV
jgi:hypothetical protein